MKKGSFVEPTVEAILFAVEDIITVSGGTNGGIVLPEDEWET